ncbi:MAG TPA: hypothetical protein VFA04_21630 [Bryobacteraceae bacterium]|nr:hypothetical protein [Bryobacteraceae bacterium]
MTASIFFVSVSLVLFAYWFRYTCLLILSTRPARDFAKDVAEANRLSFRDVQDRLAGALTTADLDALQTKLDSDYSLITCLLRHGAEFKVAGSAIEERMLMVHYSLMRRWYALARRLSVTRGRQALDEMSQIVNHFAGLMGERSAAAA